MVQTTEELRGRIDEQRSTLGYHLDELGDKVSPKRMVERRTEAVRGKLGSVKDRVMGTAAGAGDQVSDLTSQAADAARHAPDAARQQVEGNPLAAGLLAFAAGLVVAALLPETSTEQALASNVQTTLEGAASELGTAAHDTVEALKPAAHDAADAVKEQARDSAQTVKADASHTTDALSPEVPSGPALPTRSPS